MTWAIGSLKGISTMTAGMGLNVTRATDQCDGGSLQGCFSASPVYPPFIQATVTNAVAGVPDGSGCFRVVHVRR